MNITTKYIAQELEKGMYRYMRRVFVIPVEHENETQQTLKGMIRSSNQKTFNGSSRTLCPKNLKRY